MPGPTKGGLAQQERPCPHGTLPLVWLMAGAGCWAAELMHPSLPHGGRLCGTLDSGWLGLPRGMIDAIPYSASQDKVCASTHEVSACMQESFLETMPRSAQKADRQVGRRAGRQAGEDKFISARASGEWARSFSLPYSHHLILNLDKLDLALKAT